MELAPATLLKLGSFMAWSGLYAWLRFKKPYEDPEWSSRVVTLVHGTVAAITGMVQCGVFDLYSLDRCSFTSKIEPRHYALMVWSWGYFAFDLLWCLTYWSDNVLMLCHHFFALVAITTYMAKDDTGVCVACATALLEVTNPLLQIRWLLRHEGHGRSVLFAAVEVLYLALFILIRGVLGTYLIVKLMPCDFVDREGKILCLIFYLVSMAFLNEIAGYIVHRIQKAKLEFRNEFNDTLRTETDLLQMTVDQLAITTLQNERCYMTL